MKIFAFIIMLLISLHPFAQSASWNEDATPLHRSEKALTDVIVHDVFSPPAASRIYVYANITAYEVLAHSYPNLISLQTSLPQFPIISAPSKPISVSLAAVYSFLLVGRQLVFSDSAVQDSLRLILKWYNDKK